MAACPILVQDRPLGGLVPSVLCATRADCPPDVRTWLQTLRYFVEEYDDKPKQPAFLQDDIDSLNSADSAEQDHFDLNKYFTAQEDNTSGSDENVDVFSDAFDNILSNLGHEIYSLDSYHRKYFKEGESNLPVDFADDIIKLFDDVPDETFSVEFDTDSSSSSNMNIPIPKSYSNLSNLSDEVFMSCEDENVTSIDKIFDSGKAVPIPPPRRNKKMNENLDNTKKERRISRVEMLRAKFDSMAGVESRKVTRSGSDSGDYHKLWNCISGHQATVSVIKYENVKDIVSPSEFAYGKQKILVCSRPRSAVMRRSAALSSMEMVMQKCTSECDLNDDCHAELFGHPRASSVDGAEATSDCDSWTMIPSDESIENPIYENLSVYQRNPPIEIPQDVLEWRRRLLEPDYNDDEEDEWLSPEEASLYLKEQNPPFVLPRIKLARNKPISPTYQDIDDIRSSSREDDEEPKSPSIKTLREMHEERALYAVIPPAYLRGKHKPVDPHDPSVNRRSHFFPGYVDPAVDFRHPFHQEFQHGRVKSLITPPQMMSAPYKVLPRPYDPSDPNILYEGPVRRTKLTENGKKVRKNWHSNYMIITQTAIAFYKDLKSYHASKLYLPGSNAPLPELVVPLYGALVSACTAQHTSRPNTCLVTSATHYRHDQHILQHEAPERARICFETILAAINRLSKNYTCPDNSFSNQSPSPSPKHSKKYAKVSEDSVEDLTDSQEHNKVRSKLKKFFVRRPTVDLLIKKGIYKDEPVFGRSLEQVCPDVNPLVPEFVIRCIKIIESTEENLQTDGLYRASGNLSQVQKIRLEVDQNNLSILEKEPDVHVLTGALKLFFRELKEPLIPYKFYQKALNASLSKTNDARLKEFREIISAFPECNRQTLKYLLEHLLRVTLHKEQNRMHVSNLAIVFGPTLLWAPTDSANSMAISATNCLQQNQVIEILLTDFENIFNSSKNNSVKKKTAIK